MATTDSSVSPIQINRTNDFKGLSESNHLATYYMTEPEKVQGLISYLHSQRKKSTIMTQLAGGGPMDSMEVGNFRYRWPLYGRTDRAIEVAENVNTAHPGAGGSTFELPLAENWFDATDILVLDDGSQVRVQEDPRQEGNTWYYRVAKVDPNKPFIDPAILQRGHRVSKDFSAVEEYSHRGGQTTFATPFWLENQLTTIRKELSVTRGAATDALVIELPDPDDPNKTTTMWTRYADWQFHEQMIKEKEYMMIYSQFNRDPLGEVNLPGDNSRPVYMGAGLREQISPSNKRYYDRLTYQLLDDFMVDLAYAAEQWGYGAKFIALTGFQGMREFDRAVRQELSENVTVLDRDVFVTGDGQELTYKGQFIHVKFLNGIELTVQHFPPYDDLTRNRTLHPRTQKPTESYRFTIMNFADVDGKPNIRRVSKAKSDDLLWYVSGSIDPFGETAKGMTSRASSVDGYEVHGLSECGLCLSEPRSCGELIYAGDPIFRN